MIGLENFPNIIPGDSDFPDGQIKDKNGSVHGTPMNQKTFSDIFQFFQKLIRLTGIVPNGLFDCEYTGFQMIQALQLLIKRNVNLSEYNQTCSAGNFPVSFIGNSCSGSISSSLYSFIRVGNFVALTMRINVNVTAVGGGSPFFNISISTPSRARASFSKSNIPGLFFGGLATVDSSVDSSGNINTNYDNGSPPTVRIYSYYVNVNYECND